MRRGRTLVILVGLVLGACSPQAPKGANRDALDAAISNAIGDPNTCVLIGQVKSGRVLYQFGTHVTCGKELPSCAETRRRTTDDLLKTAAIGGVVTRSSCAANAENSRWVGWAAGPIQGRPDLAYAATMEGKATPPGVVIADKAENAFKTAGL